tara:strand:+ start:190 stop:540 length:351 start_codon:yes stop_codon:yes gene_type:complete
MNDELKSLGMKSIKIISGDSFNKDVIQSKTPVLVDFWAEWCGPCKVIGPILEEISEEEKDKIIIGKINVDENQEIAAKYNVRGIPTLIIFNKGNLIDTMVGVASKASIKDWINSKV